MAKEGTMQYYKDIESHNTKLRGRLLARTKKKKKETAREWINRVSAMYAKREKRPN